MESEKLRKVERKIIRKILGPKKDGEIWKRKSNIEVYKFINDVTDEMRKRRLKFAGHMERMNESRLTKHIWEYVKK